MEPFLLLVEGWWWVAPVAAGAGAAAYGRLTMKGRRARRLELDAARHEEAQASRALVEARAGVSSAQAVVLAARAESGSPLLDVVVPMSPASAEARRALASAKQREKSAWLALRAARTRIKAAEVRYHAASRTDPLPLEREIAAHDAVIGRWMVYETDAGMGLTYPQLLDARHPATAAFLEAQREAQRLRPASPQEGIPPQRFIDYRSAVRELRAAFDEAERQARAAAERDALPRPMRDRPAPEKRRTAEPPRSAEPPRPTEPPRQAEPPGQPVWPVPSWRSTRSS